MSINNNRDLAERIAKELINEQERRERDREDEIEKEIERQASWDEWSVLNAQNKALLKKKFTDAGFGEPMAASLGILTSVGLAIFAIITFIASLVVAGMIMVAFKNSFFEVLMAVPLLLESLLLGLVYSKVFNKPL